MQKIKSKYSYNESKPLMKPYEDKKIFNAYYKAYDIEDERHVLLSYYSTIKSSQLLKLQKKMQQLKSIQHEYIVHIYEIFIDVDKGQLITIMEWSQYIDITDYVSKDNTLDYKLALKIILQLLQGLIKLHYKDIIHGYINLENIEIDQKGKFKLSIKAPTHKSYYLAPEIKKNAQHSQATDLFALGVCLFRLIYGVLPFKQNNIDEYINSIAEGVPFPVIRQDDIFPIIVPKQVKNIIKQMLSYNPQTRYRCLSNFKQYAYLMNLEIILNPKIYNRIIKDKYIGLFINYNTVQNQQIVIINLKSKKIQKLEIFKSSISEIENYRYEILQPFQECSSVSMVKVDDLGIIDQQFLYIVSDYNNQFTLKEYSEIKNKNGDKFEKPKISMIIQSIKGILISWKRDHKLLTNESILIKNGHLLVKYPKLITSEISQSISQGRYKLNFYAPELSQGIQSNNTDVWSVGVLHYWLLFDIMPTFNSQNQRLVIPNRFTLSFEEIKELESQIQVQYDLRKSFSGTKMINGPMKSPRKFKQSIIHREKVMSSVSGDSLLVHLQQPINSFEKPSPRIQSFNLGFHSNNSQLEYRKKSTRKKISKKNNNSIREQNETQPLRFGQILSTKLNPLAKLQRSWSKPIRIFLKVLVGILLYLFLFYYEFFKINGTLLGEKFSYQATEINLKVFETDSVTSINYILVTKSPTQTISKLNGTTLSLIRDDYKCVLNDYSVQSDIVSIINSANFIIYQVSGFLIAMLNIIFLCLILSRIDFSKVCYITQFQNNDFSPLYNWALINCAIASLTSSTYLIYGGLFHLSLDTCLSKPQQPALQYLFKNWTESFVLRFIWIYIGIIVTYILIIILIYRPGYKLHWLFYISLICLYIAGIGSRAMGNFVLSKQCVFGVCGQLLVLLTGILFFLIDIIASCCIDKQILHEELTLDQHNRTEEDLQIQVN